MKNPFRFSILARAAVVFARAVFSITPGFAATKTGPNFVVNTLADTDDGSADFPGQATGNQDCTLREAINAASARSAASMVEPPVRRPERGGRGRHRRPSRGRSGGLRSEHLRGTPLFFITTRSPHRSTTMKTTHVLALALALAASALAQQPDTLRHSIPAPSTGTQTDGRLGACGFVEKEHLEELRPIIAAHDRH